MAVEVRINYHQSQDLLKFGQFFLDLYDDDGNQQSVQLKFDIDGLWNYARDTTSVAFDFLVMAMSVYNADIQKRVGNV